MQINKGKAMSYKGKRIISVTPAGRKRYLEILVEYLLCNRHIIDEHHWWLNTSDKNDIAYIEEITAQYPEFFRIIRGDWAFDRNSRTHSIYHFFKFCTESDTVYVRLDDDLVWVDNDTIEKMVKCKLENPEAFLVFANIVNNSLSSFLYQRLGIIPYDSLESRVNYDCMDEVGWKDSKFAEHLHRFFLKKLEQRTLSDFYYPNWKLFSERASINAICFTGEDMLNAYSFITEAEEHDLTVEIPKQFNRYNLICGDALASHFAFYIQREYLDSTDLLEKYYALAQKKRQNLSSIAF